MDYSHHENQLKNSVFELKHILSNAEKNQLTKDEKNDALRKADEIVFEIKFTLRMMRLNKDYKYFESLFSRLPEIRTFYKSIDAINKDYAYLMKEPNKEDTHTYLPPLQNHSMRQRIQLQENINKN